MPTDIAAESVASLVHSTMNKHKKEMLVWLAKQFTDLVGCKRFLRIEATSSRNLQETLRGGVQYQFEIQTSIAAVAKAIGLHTKDVLVDQPESITCTLPLRTVSTSYYWDEQEITINTGEEKIFDILDAKRAAALQDKLELLETGFWSKPTDETDVLTPWGIGMWIVKNASQGWTGALPSGFTSLGGVTDSRFRNYSYPYTACSDTDLVAKLREMIIRLGFKPYPRLPNMVEQPVPDFEGFCNLTTYLGLEDLAKKQNQNLGTDLSYAANMVTIRGVPITYVPALDSDTSNPVYLINMRDIQTMVRPGWFFRESKPKDVQLQHNSYAMFIDTTYGLKAEHRRMHGISYIV